MGNMKLNDIVQFLTGTDEKNHPKSIVRIDVKRQNQQPHRIYVKSAIVDILQFAGNDTFTIIALNFLDNGEFGFISDYVDFHLFNIEKNDSATIDIRDVKTNKYLLKMAIQRADINAEQKQIVLTGETKSVETSYH